MRFNPQPKPEPKPKNKKKWIKPLSDKRKKEYDLYYSLLPAWKEGKVCLECGNPNIDAHHPYGKEGYLEDGTPLLCYMEVLKPLCRKHHRKAEDEPEWAKSKGYSYDRIPFLIKKNNL